MRRLIIPFLLTALATPAFAWQATSGETCILTHDTTDTRIHLTYDPDKPLYTLAITRKSAPWQQAPWFAMRFLGPNEITITTPKHALSDNDQTLNVADSGFGNVLDGLQFNQVALAFTQSQTVEISLKDAAPEVQKFRDCTAAQLSYASRYPITSAGFCLSWPFGQRLAQKTESLMHVKITFTAIALSTLAACATPLERCLNTANGEVKHLQGAISTAEANISRGYALHRTQEAIVVPKHCFTEKGRRYRCDETEYHTIEIPVDIDIGAERAKRDRLRRDLRSARAAASRQSDQCFAAHPEG